MGRVNRREYPLAAAVDDLRRGRTTPRAAVESANAAMEAVEPEIRAFVSETARWKRIGERVGEIETAHDAKHRRPPLYGVVVGVKDVFHVDGMETRAGSELPPDAITGPQGTAVDRLEAAGAVVLGKTVTAEFAYFEPGPTRNPHDTAHTPGGSSSGSAAAVAAGVCPLAIGTQTIGSITRPAAFCGIVGVKPSFGRIPTDGLVPAAPSVDHVGFFTQDVAGATVAAAVLCEDWQQLPAPHTKPTLGVSQGPYLEQADEAALAAFEEQIEQLSAAGYGIERVDLFGEIEPINERHERLVAAEMAITHEEWDDEYGDRYAAATRDLIERGKDVTAGDIGAAIQGRARLRERVTKRMDEEGVDVWLSPAAPGPAPEGIDDTGDPVMNLPWTHAGLPTVSLPAGSVEGLPVGLQCAGRFGADEELLAWAAGLAESLPG